MLGRISLSRDRGRACVDFSRTIIAWFVNHINILMICYCSNDRQKRNNSSAAEAAIRRQRYVGAEAPTP